MKHAALHPDASDQTIGRLLPSKWAAAAVTVGLSLLFMVVYGGCNWITSQRNDIGTWYYSWERFIPFVPIMIVPYMSIDLFFVAGPFLCRSKAELRTLVHRITFAILVAGLFFLLMPLTLAIPRPQVTGWEKPIFDLLYGFDQPYNLFPSLHITLRTILAALYARHTRGILRFASNVWFSLIGLSTLLTYQHHIVDVASGFVLAGVCFYLYREPGFVSSKSLNRRVGLYYALGAALLGIAAWACWPWTSVLLWPVLALALTAWGYLQLGSAIYRKTNGQLPPIVRVLFAPCLFGQHLSLLYYRQHCPAWSEVTPHLWISAKLNHHEAATARLAGVRAVLDLTAEFSETNELRALHYHNIALLDLTAPDPAQLHEAVEFISKHERLGILCVHCKVGYSRSAAVVGAYLLWSKRAATVEEVIAHLRTVRPNIVIRPEAMEALSHFHEKTFLHQEGRPD